MIQLWPMLLPVAAFSGFWFAKRSHLVHEPEAHRPLSREYVVGLNYLLNEQPDKAVDVFIKLLEVDSDTVETHLALGSLFRRNGEVDRAIRIHQNLIARPQLSLTQRKESLMALANDYMSAGVYDRAERIFLEVADLGGPNDTSSLSGLLAIYEQEKSWDKALDIVKQLPELYPHEVSAQAAHYYCEIAEQLLAKGLNDQAYGLMKQALLVDKQCVRASMMLAKHELAYGKYKVAIRTLKRVLQQDPSFFTEVIPGLLQAYQHIQAMDECISYLEHVCADYPSAKLIFAIGDYVREEKSLDVAIEFVSMHLSKHPSIRGLNQLITWHLESTHGIVKDRLQMLFNITSKFLELKPVYRCHQCGYSGTILHWLCPSCKQWGKTKPIHGLEGD